MIGAVIDHVKKHLPHDEVPVFIGFLDRLIEQHLVPQIGKIIAHPLLNAVPIRANHFSIISVINVTGIGRHWFQGLDACQLAEPDIVDVDEVKDLISNRSMRVVRVSPSRSRCGF